MTAFIAPTAPQRDAGSRCRVTAEGLEAELGTDGVLIAGVGLPLFYALRDTIDYGAPFFMTFDYISVAVCVCLGVGLLIFNITYRTGRQERLDKAFNNRLLDR